jgi:hypothetical protein
MQIATYVFTTLALFMLALCPMTACGQVVVEPYRDGSFDLGPDNPLPNEWLLVSSSDTGYHWRSNLVYDPTQFPAAFSRATFRIVATDPHPNYGIVDVTFHTRCGIGGSSFDIVWNEPYSYAGNWNIENAGPYELDVTDCVMELMALDPPCITIRLSVPIWSNQGAQFASIYNTGLPHPAIVFEEVVDQKDDSWGRIKNDYR